MKLRIDNQEIELGTPVSIWKAAKDLGIEIPTLCYQEGLEHITSCMICTVKDKASGRLLPACSAPVAEGMDIETVNDQIRAFRKSTLELLLSDHVGDCEAPCQRLCPLHMDIPGMMRHVRADAMPRAVEIVRRDIAIPSILERYCNVPCERGCRRGKQDSPISIRELTRYSSDWDLQQPGLTLPQVAPASGKTVAIIGAGATGLSAAYYLAVRGHACTVFEREGRVGGRIEAEFKRPIEDWVVEGELRLLRQLGVVLRLGEAVLDAAAFDALRSRYGAVVVACGKTAAPALAQLGLPATEKGLKVDAVTWATQLPGVFAAGSVLKPAQPLIKSVAAAKEAAACVDQFLRGEPITGIIERYNHIMGRLLDGEIETFMEGANPVPRVTPSEGEIRGFLEDEAKLECTRCLHCDCRAKEDCLLREHSTTYDAKQSQFAGLSRAEHIHISQNAGALYEPGKCIKCGLCVKVTDQHDERFGFTYVGRGFDVKIGVPLGRDLKAGLGAVVNEVVAACPTGALAHEDPPPKPGGEDIGGTGGSGTEGRGA